MSQVVRDFYNASPSHEWERLARPYRRLEFASTMRLIEKHFPARGHVVDIGCGPGRYSIELMKRGYSVTLVDLSEGQLDIARQHIVAEGLEAEAIVRADACHLESLASGSADAVLLMGPLYHLVKPEDRMQALMETRRILKPGGVAIAAYLNSWGIMRALLTEVPAYYRDLDAIYRLTGEFVQVGPQSGFTEAYFTVPPAARAEVESAGFDIVSYAGVESFCSGCLEPVKAISETDPQAYQNILKVAAELCEAPQYRDDTEHLHFVVRKPGRAAEPASDSH